MEEIINFLLLLVEEMVDHDGELRVLVLHGRVEVAATDSRVSNILDLYKILSGNLFIQNQSVVIKSHLKHINTV